MNQRDETEWIECKLQKNALVTALAEVAWKADTQRISTDKLYNPDGTVRDEWAHLFWSAHSSYECMLESYIKPIEYGDIKTGP